MSYSAEETVLHVLDHAKNSTELVCSNMWCDGCLLPEHEDLPRSQKSISCLLLLLLWFPSAL